MAASRLCAIPECGKAAYKREWCNRHYIRWRRHGDPRGGGTPLLYKAGDPCRVAGCDVPASRVGYCNAHYLKDRRHGDPLAGKTMPRDRPTRRQWLDDNAVSFAEPLPCLIFPYGKSNGYGQASIEDGELIGAHRYVCEKVHGAPPSPDHEAAHSCGNRGCVSRWHLRWATPKENAADCLLHGTDSRGERNGNSKLTQEQVREIRRLHGAETGKSLGERFGVTPTQISHIQLFKQWSYDR